MLFNILFLILIVLLPGELLAGEITYQKTFTNGPNDVNGRSVLVTQDGRIILGGSEDNDGTGHDHLLMELSPMGQILGQETFGNSSVDLLTKLIDYDNGIVTAVGSLKDVFGAGDFCVFQYDYNTDSLLWTKVFGGTTYENYRDAARGANGDIYAMVSSYSFPTGNWNPLIIKIDNSGTVVWKKKISGSSIDQANGIAATNDGGCAVTGLTLSSSAYGQDIFLTKLDSTGAIEWSRNYDYNYYDQGKDVVQTVDGKYFITGNMNATDASVSNSRGDIVLIKTDTVGNVEWNVSYSRANRDKPEKMILKSSGNLVIAGYTENGDGGKEDAFVIEVEPNGGNIVWGKMFGGSEDDYFKDLAEAPNGDMVFSGYSESFNGSGKKEAYLVRTDSEGNSASCYEYSWADTNHFDIWQGNSSFTMANAGNEGTFSGHHEPSMGDSVLCEEGTGKSCSEAIAITDTFNFVQSHYSYDDSAWFKFIASDTLITFVFQNDFDENLPIDSVEMYSNSCGSLDFVLKEFRNDTTNRIHLFIDSAMVDSVYFMKVFFNKVNDHFYVSTKSGCLQHFYDEYYSAKYSPGNFGDNIECYVQSNYYPIDAYNNDEVVKTIRVVFHTFRNDDGRGGFLDIASHRNYINGVINAANWRLANSVPTVPPPTKPSGSPYLRHSQETYIKLQLENMYFHDDTYAWELTKNLFGSAHGTYLNYMYDNYVTNNSSLTTFYKDSCLHIFNGERNYSGHGVAFKGSKKGVVVTDGFWSYLRDDISVTPKDDHAQEFAELILHEIGHSLSLGHPFENGNCVYSPPKAKYTSNNTMTYGSPKTSFSECQLSKMNYAIMANTGGLHDILEIDFCNLDENSTITINNGENITWNSSKYLDGEIIIKNGAKLNIKCYIGLAKNSKITVERGGVLIIDGGRITTSCNNNLWHGIEVWGYPNENHPTATSVLNGTYPTGTGNEHGVVVLKNGAMIENARDGISTLKRVEWAPYHDAAYFGGMIIADDAIFRDCHRAVEFMQFRKTSNSYFKDVTFETTKYPLNNGVLPKYFVSIWDVNGVDFTNCRFINRVPGEYDVDARGGGLLSIGGNYTLTKKCPSPPCNLTEFDRNEFESLRFGVQVSGVSSNLNTQIDGNVFENNHTAITLNDAHFINVIYNDIEVGDESYSSPIFINGVATSSVLLLPTGIRSYGSSFNKIESNDIELSGSTETRGIYSIGNGRFPQRIYDNYIYGGGDEGVAFPNSFKNYETIYECNTSTADQMDHYVLYNYAAIANPQGNSKKAAGNNLNQTCSSSSNEHFQLENSSWPILYFSSTSNNFRPDNNCVNISNRFSLSTTAVENDCPLRYRYSGVGVVNPDIGIGDINIEQGDIQNSIDDAYTNLDGGNTVTLLENAKDETYSSTTLTSDLNSNAPISDEVLIASIFRDNALNMTKLADILLDNAPHSAIVWNAIDESGIDLPSAKLDTLGFYQDSTTSRSALMDSLRYLKAQKKMNYIDIVHFAVDDTTYSMNRVIDSLKLEEDNSLKMMLIGIYMSQLYEEFDSAEALLADMYIPFKEDSHMVSIKNMELELLQNGENWFDLESELINDLEGYTSYDDTTAAIFAAQGIIELINDTLYERPYEVNPGGSKRGDLNENFYEDNLKDSYRLIPNPLEGSKIAYVDIGDAEEGVLYLYTINGVNLGHIDLKQGNNNIDLNNTIKTPGIYIYQIEIEGEVKTRNKLVLLK